MATTACMCTAAVRSREGQHRESLTAAVKTTGSGPVLELINKGRNESPENSRGSDTHYV